MYHPRSVSGLTVSTGVEEVLDEEGNPVLDEDGNEVTTTCFVVQFQVQMAVEPVTLYHLPKNPNQTYVTDGFQISCPDGVPSHAAVRDWTRLFDLDEHDVGDLEWAVGEIPTNLPWTNGKVVEKSTLLLNGIKSAKNGASLTADGAYEYPMKLQVLAPNRDRTEEWQVQDRQFVVPHDTIADHGSLKSGSLSLVVASPFGYSFGEVQSIRSSLLPDGQLPSSLAESMQSLLDSSCVLPDSTVQTTMQQLAGFLGMVKEELTQPLDHEALLSRCRFPCSVSLGFPDHGGEWNSTNGMFGWAGGVADM